VVRWVKVVASLIVAIFIVYLLASSTGTMKKEKQEQVRLIQVDPHDLRAMSRWARRRCSGWTVEQVAAVGEVEPTMDSVLDYLSEGYPSPAAHVVRRVCEQELRRAGEQGDVS
jgi:hypothetical protein